MRPDRIIFLGLFTLFAACKQEQSPAPSPTPTPNPTVTDTRYPVNLIVDSLTLEDIRTSAVTNADLAGGVTSILLSPAATALTRTPMPYSEANSTNFDDISSQGRDMRSLAVRWLYTYRTAPDAAKP